MLRLVPETGRRVFSALPQKAGKGRSNLSPVVDEGSGADERLRREGPRRKRAGSPLQGGTGGPPPESFRWSSTVAGHGHKPGGTRGFLRSAAEARFRARGGRFRAAPHDPASGAWRSGSDRVGFAHQPGFFRPARRRPPPQRRRAGRGRQAGGRGNYRRKGCSALPARPASVERARPESRTRKPPGAKAPDSGSVAGGDSRGLRPVEFAERGDRGEAAGDERDAGRAVWPGVPRDRPAAAPNAPRARARNRNRFSGARASGWGAARLFRCGPALQAGASGPPDRRSAWRWRSRRPTALGDSCPFPGARPSAGPATPANEAQGKEPVE